MSTHRIRRSLVTLFAAAAVLAVPAQAGATELFYATTPTNILVSFTAQAPSRILTTRALSGLAAGETVIGLDQRPATGELFAVTSSGRVIVIERNSGVVKQIGGTTLALTGTAWGIDVNPSSDRIRLVSDADQNLRINPDTGALGTSDPVLAYRAGDAGAGANPNITAIAHSGGKFGAAAPTTTTLFGLDTDRNTLVKQEPLNSGTLVTIGALGVDAMGHPQLDIASDQTTYAAFATTATGAPSLWRISTTGLATKAAANQVIGVNSITSMTAVGQIDDDLAGPTVAVGNYTAFRSVWLQQGLRFTTACNEDCTITVTLRIDGKVAGATTTSMGTAGTRAPRITLTKAGRVLAGGTSSKPATLTFSTVDAAGRTRTQVTTFTSKAHS